MFISLQLNAPVQSVYQFRECNNKKQTFSTLYTRCKQEKQKTLCSSCLHMK